MNITKITSIIFFIINLSMNTLQPSEVIQDNDSELISPVKLVDQIIASYKKEKNVSGIAVALYIGGKGYLLNYGLADKEKNKPVSEETLFEIASITKVFTSTELALEVLRGRLKLSDLVIQFLPKIDSKNRAISHLTLKQLATHTSSLPRQVPPLKNNSTLNKQRIMEFLQQWNVEDSIDSQYLYSNLGFGLLGFALENVENIPYEQLIKADILEPLNMNFTMFEVSEKLMNQHAQGYSIKGLPVPKLAQTPTPASGALRSTSKDMLTFLEANLGVKGPKNLLLAMQFAQKERYKVNDKLTMGLGWQRVYVNNNLTIDKNGGLPGFSSYIGFMPEQKLGIVILINQTKGDATKLGRQVLMRLSTFPANLNH